VKVVDIKHVRHVNEMGAYLAELEVIGSRLQGSPCVAEQAPRRPFPSGRPRGAMPRVCSVPNR